jgi:hypothetical protein
MANLSATSVRAACEQLAALADTTPIAGGTLTINGKALGNYDYVKKTGNQTVSAFLNSDWFTATADSVSAFVIVVGDLTINAGQVFTPTNRKLFTTIYVTGNLIVNGQISMTKRGANHSTSGSNITPQDIVIANGIYSAITDPIVPAAGGNGAPGCSYALYFYHGVDAVAGVGGQTGGGGSGADRNGTLSAPGAAGTCFSGGPASGAASWPGTGVACGIRGGFGGSASTTAGGQCSGGGAGNPAGVGGTGGGGATVTPAEDGTGGTLLIFVKLTYSGSGTVTAAGGKGGDAHGTAADGAGAGSGGGSITLLCKTNSGPTPTALGGVRGLAFFNGAGMDGGTGGNGSVRVLVDVPIALTATPLNTAAASIGSPALKAISNFSANPIAVSSPSIGIPAFGQLQIIAANSIAVARPNFGIAVFVQSYGLVAVDRTTAAASLGTTAINQTHSLVAVNETTAAPSVSSANLVLVFHLQANSLSTSFNVFIETPTLFQQQVEVAVGDTTSAPSLGTPAFYQYQVIIAVDELTTSASIGSPVIGQRHVVDSQTVATSSPGLGAPALVQRHVAVANDLASARPALLSPRLDFVRLLDATSIFANGADLGKPPIKQRHQLLAETLAASAPNLVAPDAAIISHAIADYISVDTVIDVPSLTLCFNLLAKSKSIGWSVHFDPPLLKQVHQLDASVQLSAPFVPAPTLRQRHLVGAVDAVNASPDIGVASLTQHYFYANIAISVYAARPSIDSPSMVQQHLTNANQIAARSPSIGAPAIGQIDRNVSNGISASAPSIGAPPLRQAHRITAAFAVARPAIGTPVYQNILALAALNLAVARVRFDPNSFELLYKLNGSSIGTARPSINSTILSKAIHAADLFNTSLMFSPAAILQRNLLSASNLVVDAEIKKPTFWQDQHMAPPSLGFGRPYLGTVRFRSNLLPSTSSSISGKGDLIKDVAVIVGRADDVLVSGKASVIKDVSGIGHKQRIN